MALFTLLDLLIDPEPRSAALNMALDEALLAVVEKPLLRCYRWSRPAVSYGYFVRFAEVAHWADDRELVRRWTGGGVVLHGDDFTYSLLVPKAERLAQVPAAEAYARIHAAVATTLRGAALAAVTAAKRSEACFENPAESDVLVGGRKVAGAAQRRTRAGLLHQGSVQGVTLPADLAPRLARQMAPAVQEYVLRESDLADAQTLAAQKYGTPAWLHRF